MFFLFISITLFLAIVYFMPKKISYTAMYATSLFAAVLQLLTDMFLEFKFELYGYFEKGVEPETLLIIFAIYPPLNVIFLNFFPFQKKITIKIGYLISWTIFSLFYEWLSVISGIFYYDGWKLWYSAPIYPLIFFIILANLQFTKTLNKSNK